MNHSAEFYISRLNLEPHPEGGYFRENYRSADQLAVLPSRYTGQRSASTAIYYLLRGDQFSAFHQVMSDEIWHFYDGCCLELYIIDHPDKLAVHKLGRDIDKDEQLQVAVPMGHWFAAQPVDPSGYTLAGCTVSPGFDFRDFKMGERNLLMQLYPEHGEIIRKYTKGK